MMKSNHHLQAIKRESIIQLGKQGSKDRILLKGMMSHLEGEGQKRLAGDMLEEGLRRSKGGSLIMWLKVGRRGNSLRLI